MHVGRARWLVWFGATFVFQAALALDVVITRHAETLANVTGVYSSFNQRHFSETGLRQIDELTAALGDRRFDAILVSPAHRCIKSIQPYLERVGAQAEIWPELDECCWIPEGRTEKTPPPEPILLEPEQRSLFVLRANAGEATPGSESYVDGVKRVRAAVNLLLERYKGRDATILVMTHHHTGGRLAEALLGESLVGRYKIKNATFTHLREVEGRFRLIELNRPTEPALAPVEQVSP